ncbi:MAG TPA: phage holin family protein, partial [Chondromyces sp.]|nr:phage holin family protein [Chondromyces sp.]
SLLLFLLVIIAIDYITGLLAAGVKGQLNSLVGLKGIAKKVFILALIVVANIVDTILDTNSFVRNLTIIFYLSNEMLSIIENAGSVGLPIPSFLKKAIESLKDEESTKE